MKEISAQALKPLLTDGDEIAFLDVREHGQYGEGHPFFAVPLPYSRIEGLAPRLIPCRAVRCVVMDDGDGVGARAAAVLADLGYSDVAVLAGGVAWLWFQSWQIGAVIAAAMVINMFVAGLFGTLIPIGLEKTGVDPAVASTVFLTTVTDVVGFLAFLGLAAIFLL